LVVFWSALLAVVVFALPKVAFGKIQTFVVLPRRATVATDHLSPTDVALVAANAADNGILLLFLLFSRLC
jgi:hypothetical protein